MRMIFSTVRAPQLPAFTVGSLAPMRPHPVVSSCAPRSRISNALAPVLVASYGCDHLDAQISRRPHQSLPLEVGFALLEEGLDALTGVLCLRDQQELAVQVM